MLQQSPVALPLAEEVSNSCALEYRKGDGVVTIMDPTINETQQKCGGAAFRFGSYALLIILLSSLRVSVI
jgi:hypothetical protein